VDGNEGKPAPPGADAGAPTETSAPDAPSRPDPDSPGSPESEPTATTTPDTGDAATPTTTRTPAEAPTPATAAAGSGPTPLDPPTGEAATPTNPATPGSSSATAAGSNGPNPPGSPGGPGRTTASYTGPTTPASAPADAAAGNRPATGSPDAAPAGADADSDEGTPTEPATDPGNGKSAAAAAAGAGTEQSEETPETDEMAPVARGPAAPGAAVPAYGASREAQGPIFDLPDHVSRPGETAGTLVLGGAAAAEGRTTGGTPRIGGPGPAGARVTGVDEEAGKPAAEEAGGRHFSGAGARQGIGRITWPSRPSWPVLGVAVPIAVVVILLVAWAVDTAALSGQVMRNVEVAGRPVGGLGEASLPEVMTDIGDELAARPVRVTAGDQVYETTAGELGLSIDDEATSEAALDAGRSDPLFVRPFSWLGSFFSPRQVDVRYSVMQSQVQAKMTELQGADLTAPQAPTIQLTGPDFVAVPGVPGQGIDTADVAEQLPLRAAETPEGTIEIETELVPISPPYTDEDAQELADRANEMTANGLGLTAGETTVQVDPQTVRSWIGATTVNGPLDLAINPDKVNADLIGLFSGVSAAAVNASFDVQNGVPVVIPSRQGVACCGPTSPDVVWQALLDQQSPAALEVQVTEPELTTEEAQGLGITQAVGGNNAWRNGGPTTAGPGFTTYYDAGQPRVTNIHRIADLVRGAVIMPGDTFSVNNYVGPRTAAKGFVLAGAIRDGVHQDEIGGGVSQFATTTFNAAYFAGLDILTYQAHTESFSRYPPGREATMGYPSPDLRIRNNTPYGILIWPTYTASSLTVTLYSTPWATGEQTGISESMSGACRNVTTTRTRTFPDGHTENDTFRATYRPGEGQFC
jgi:vancomycin resistance protein YoaR